MEKELEKLDISMKSLTLDLIKYRKDSMKYKQILAAINTEYQACKILCLTKNNKNKPYLFKYANITEIEALLSNAGYLEQPKKPVSH